MNQKMPTIDEVLKSPCTHGTLKRALQAFLEVDPVDAAADTELLALLIKERCHKMLGMAIVLLSIAAADIPLQTAGQTSAPVCIEYCEAQS